MIIRGLTFIVWIFCNVCTAQYNVFELDVASNKLLFNEHDNRIYASIPSANGSNGNSIGVINPQTLVLETTVFVGSEPNEIAISDNGEFLYIGFTSSPVVKQFDLNLQTITQQVQLGIHYSGNQPLYAEDIEVMPGNANTIAVARRRYGVSPRHGGVVIIENGIPRPNEVVGHTGSNKIEFRNAEVLFGYTNESSGFELHELSVSDQGVTAQNSYPYVLTGFGVDMIFGNDHLYSTNGRAYNLVPSPYQVGVFNGASGPVYYNSIDHHVCYVTSATFGSSAHFSVYDAQSFLLVDEFTVNETDGTALSVTGCGYGCYAFNTSETIYILKSIETGTQSISAESNTRIHPNPTKGPLYIQSDVDLHSAELVDLSGQTIVTTIGSNIIDLAGISNGLYILKVLDTRGNYSTHRLIKN